MPNTTTKVIRPQYPDHVIGSSHYQKPLNAIVRRLTNSQREFKYGSWTPGSVLGGYTSNSEPHWSNCDDSLLAVASSKVVTGARRDTVGIWGRDMRLIKEMPAGIGQPYLRWSATVPRHLFHFRQGVIERYNVESMKRDRWSFGFNLGLAGGEGDVADTNEILLDKDGKTLFVYDLNTMSVVSGSYSPSTLDLGSLGAKGTAQGVDYATLSQDGNYILVSWSGRCGAHSGIEVYDRRWNYIHRVYPGVVHWCNGIDTAGRPVIYTTMPFGYPDYMAAWPECNPGDYVKIHVDTGMVVKLLSIPKWSHHMTCKARGDRGHVYVTFEEREVKATIKTLWTQPDWFPFWGELLEVNTNGGGFRRLCHTWCRPSKVVKKPAKYWQPDNFAFAGHVGFRSCVVNDKVAAMATGIGDIFYVNV